MNRVRFEAQQAVERANGEPEAKLKSAEADRQSTILSAQGRAEGIRLEGESRAGVLRMNAEILKTSPLAVDLAKADRWNGALPLTLPRALAVCHFYHCSPAKHPKRGDAILRCLAPTA